MDPSIPKGVALLDTATASDALWGPSTVCDAAGGLVVNGPTPLSPVIAATGAEAGAPRVMLRRRGQYPAADDVDAGSPVDNAALQVR